MLEIRTRFKKKGPSRYISHLDMMQAMQRSFSRSGLPVRYTEGFNPHSYVSLLLPLPTGFESEYELMDFDLNEELTPGEIGERLNSALPPGVEIVEVFNPVKKPRDIGFAGYDITLDVCAARGPAVAMGVRSFINTDSPVVTAKKSKPPKPARDVNIKDYIASFSVDIGSEGLPVIRAVLRADEQSLSPVYIVQALRENGFGEVSGAKYSRTAIFDRNGVFFK